MKPSITLLKSRLEKTTPLSPLFGRISKITPSMLYASGLNPRLGDLVSVELEGGSSLGIVSTIEEDNFGIMPFNLTHGFGIGDRVVLKSEGLCFPIGDGLLGRVVSALGVPIDNLGQLSLESTPILTQPIAPLNRALIKDIFTTGVKSIDAFLTCGRGQKVGIFAGSGGGKSTLLSMIMKGAQIFSSDEESKKGRIIKVVALIGERGREVPEFIENNLGGNLENTVIIVATSDDSPLLRKYGAFYAMAVAEFFKDRGDDVLFIMDSVTRFAMAQREIGLSLGEPPASKGYPPSTLTLLPKLMERCGIEKNKGAITAFFTVLAEGDDMNDPIADQCRSILDGHIVLSRDLAQSGKFPPIDILASASRVQSGIIESRHKELALKFRRSYSLLKENELLLRIGSYVEGGDKELDYAVSRAALMEEFLAQGSQESFAIEETLAKLEAIVG